MDEMLKYRNSDGIIQVYFDHSRPRIGRWFYLLEEMKSRLTPCHKIPWFASTYSPFSMQMGEAMNYVVRWIGLKAYLLIVPTFLGRTTTSAPTSFYSFFLASCELLQKFVAVWPQHLKNAFWNDSESRQTHFLSLRVFRRQRRLRSSTNEISKPFVLDNAKTDLGTMVGFINMGRRVSSSAMTA